MPLINVVGSCVKKYYKIYEQGVPSSKLPQVSFPLLNLFLTVFFGGAVRRLGKFPGLTGTLFVPIRRMEA